LLGGLKYGSEIQPSRPRTIYGTNHFHHYNLLLGVRYNQEH
jgi:hypothetical protein